MFHLVEATSTPLVIPIFSELCHVWTSVTFWHEGDYQAFRRRGVNPFMLHAIYNGTDSCTSQFITPRQQDINVFVFHDPVRTINIFVVLPAINTPNNYPPTRICKSRQSFGEV